MLEEEIVGFQNKDNGKYCALALLVRFNDDLCVSDLLENKDTENKFKHTLKLCGLPENTPPSSIKNYLNSIKGYFVKKVGDTYHFYHDFVMEVTTHVFGKYYPIETVKDADVGFLRRRLIKIGANTYQKTDDNSGGWTPLMLAAGTDLPAYNLGESDKSRRDETVETLGCGANWIEFKGHCYFYGKHQTVSWFDAKAECQNMFSHLVEIDDKAESDWLASTFLNPDGNYATCPSNIFGGCRAWTGLNDLNIEGQYVWDHSNTPMVFFTWYIFEPSLGDVRDCVDILRNGQWNDRPCSVLIPFICEKENTHIL
uniref:C-type lectin domain-containing protein n=1 Tax=Magallana gigas TaxID=29159 RepID=A0A8W8P0L5_MAGGI